MDVKTTFPHGDNEEEVYMKGKRIVMCLTMQQEKLLCYYKFIQNIYYKNLKTWFTKILIFF